MKMKLCKISHNKLKMEVLGVAVETCLMLIGSLSLLAQTVWPQ